MAYCFTEFCYQMCGIPGEEDFTGNSALNMSRFPDEDAVTGNSASEMSNSLSITHPHNRLPLDHFMRHDHLRQQGARFVELADQEGGGLSG